MIGGQFCFCAEENINAFAANRTLYQGTAYHGNVTESNLLR